MINFLTADKAPAPESVLPRMSEDGKCLLTGATENLCYFPVDTNPQNFLPSNMSCVTHEIASQISYTVYYEAEFIPGCSVTFDSPLVFEDYNRQALEIAAGQWDLGALYKNEAEWIAQIYIHLTARHVKGIFKISSGKYSMDNQQFQGYMIRAIAEEKTKPKSNIITPPSGLATQ